MKQRFWRETYWRNITFYMGVLPRFRLGIELGKESSIDLIFFTVGFIYWSD